MMTTVAIVGATGTLGKHLTNGFLRHGSWKVTCVTRQDSSKPGVLEDFKSKGAFVKNVDFSNPESIQQAFTGQEVVVCALGAGGMALQPALIAAAKAAGVKRFVPSEFGINLSAPGMREYIPVMAGKYAARDLVQASGMEWTFVCTGFFLETLFTVPFYFDVPGGKATIKGRTDVPFTLTSMVDIGRWTAQALTDPASRNATVLLKGEDLTMDQAVSILEAATGRKFEVTRVSTEELDQQIASAPTPVAAFRDVLLRAMSDGRTVNPDDQVLIAADADTRTLAKYASSHREGMWAWGGVA